MGGFSNTDARATTQYLCLFVCDGLVIKLKINLKEYKINFNKRINTEKNKSNKKDSGPWDFSLVVCSF